MLSSDSAHYTHTDLLHITTVTELYRLPVIFTDRWQHSFIYDINSTTFFKKHNEFLPSNEGPAKKGYEKVCHVSSTWQKKYLYYMYIKRFYNDTPDQNINEMHDQVFDKLQNVIKKIKQPIK